MENASKIVFDGGFTIISYIKLCLKLNSPTGIHLAI